MEKKDAYLFLSSVYRINIKHIEIIRNEYDDVNRFLELSQKEIIKNKNLNSNFLKNIVKYKSHSRMEKIKRILSREKIKYLCIEDDEYPEKLKNIPDPPPVLFYKGDISILNDKNELNMAVVGARQPSTYGIECTKKIVRELSQEGINIISGLAFGIDSISHLSCMEGNGKTIAVLGSSVDNIRPLKNKYIADEILKNGGAIISDFFIRSKVYPGNYASRNRIISGISDGVLIMEASEKSGALITCDLALDQGKNVFAVPGNINSKMSKGCNKIIKEGAKLVEKVEDILEEYDFFPLNNTQYSIEYDIKGLNLEQIKILDLIKKQGNVNIDDICKYTDINIKSVNSNINELLIKDYIMEMENKTYGFNI